MPAMQQIYSSLSLLAFVGPSLDKLYEDLKNLKQKNQYKYKKNFNLNKKIILKNIYYKYTNTSQDVRCKYCQFRINNYLFVSLKFRKI